LKSGGEIDFPIEKRSPKGKIYTRVASIEATLAELTKLSRDEILERFKAHDRADSRFVPSKCILHFLRTAKLDNSDLYFERLYKILMRRVIGLPPRLLPLPSLA